jgi:D-alanyl-D-alanine carboxypeptidase (penicillin-binding protein 5/6)
MLAKIPLKKIVLINIGVLIFCVIWAFIFLSLPRQDNNLLQAYIETASPSPIIPTPTPTPTPLPVNVSNVLPPEIFAEGAYVVDMTTNTILYEKNSNLQLFPASTTKIMTALIALADYKLSDVVTIGKPLQEGQIMHLIAGEKITVENLLYGILVHSANDAALALAENHSGGVDGFVTRMNEKAQSLNLTQTRFTNPIGLDDVNHYTTVKDLATISLEALKNPEIVKIVAIPQITVSDINFTRFHPLKNVNELLGKIPGVSGLKTGYTEIAGQALVTTVQRNGHEILIVLLKSTDRFGETEKLINWIFTNFTWK